MATSRELRVAQLVQRGLIYVYPNGTIGVRQAPGDDRGIRWVGTMDEALAIAPDASPATHEG